MSGKLSPQALDQMRQQDYLSKNRALMNVEGTKVSSNASFDDRFKAIEDDLSLSLSDQLKKLRVAFLREANKKCYQDKWLSDDMPNEPQISLCKSETYEKHFGKWDDQVHKLRERSEFKFKDCIASVGNHPEEIVECAQSYLNRAASDNDTLRSFFAENYSKYM